VVTASADPEVTASLPDSEGGSRVSQILTFGLRVRPPLRGLSVDLAIDVGLSSAGLAYGPPTAPYNLLLGIAWAADLWPPEPPRAPSAAAAATAARAVPPDRATLAQVEGSVVDERNQEVRATVRFAREDDRAGAVPAPVPAATPEAALARPVPAVPAPAPTPVVAESGTFVVALPAGRYRVEVSAPGFEPATTGIRLLPGSLQRLDFRLRAIAAPAPAAAAVEAGDAAASWLGERDRRERIRFDRGSFQLQAWTRAYLDRVAAAMNGPQKSARLRIIGHTDDLGAARSNSALSLRRAKVVRDYLVGRGVSPLRLIVEGAGAARPLVPGNSREARAQNRRVELVPDETAAVRGGPGAAGGGW
jgi:outer membrane protein OmpA-like peptidoglycan-associated protein